MVQEEGMRENGEDAERRQDGGYHHERLTGAIHAPAGALEAKGEVAAREVGEVGDEEGNPGHGGNAGQVQAALAGEEFGNPEDKEEP